MESIVKVIDSVSAKYENRNLIRVEILDTGF